MSNDHIAFQVGKRFQSLSTNQVPPVGTQIIVHKHLTKDGFGATAEGTGHEWKTVDSNADGNAFMDIKVLTKIVQRDPM